MQRSTYTKRLRVETDESEISRYARAARAVRRVPPRAPRRAVAYPRVLKHNGASDVADASRMAKLRLGRSIAWMVRCSNEPMRLLPTPLGEAVSSKSPRRLECDRSTTD